MSFYDCAISVRVKLRLAYYGYYFVLLLAFCLALRDHSLDSRRLDHEFMIIAYV